MTKRFWSTMLAVTMGAAPALAQTPTAPRAATTPAPRMAPVASTEDELEAFAALDVEDRDLFTADLDGGAAEAPMGDEGPRMAGMHDGHDGPMGLHGRRAPDGPMGMHGRGGPDGPMGGMHAHWAMMAERLQLTDAQREKIHGILEQQLRRGIQERADIQLATLDLHQLVHADKPSLASIDAQVDKLARLRATLAKQRIASMLEAHAVLTPEQREKLRHGPMGGGWRDGRDDDDSAEPSPGAHH